MSNTLRRWWWWWLFKVSPHGGWRKQFCTCWKCRAEYDAIFAKARDEGRIPTHHVTKQPDGSWHIERDPRFESDIDRKASQ